MGKTLEKDRIDKILDTVMKVARGHYSVQIELSGKNDEFDSLAMGINMMINDIRTREEELQQEITERKRVEEELRREKENSEAYLTIAGVILAIIDADENISLINKKGCEVLGYQEGELIVRNWFETLLPQRIKDEIRGVFGKLMDGDTEPVEYYENPLLSKDGEERLIAFHNTVIKNPRGQIVGVLLSGEDITERKQMEEKLQQSEGKLRQMFASITDGLAVTDLNGVINDVNARLVEMHGFDSRDEILGKYASELLASFDRDRAMLHMQKILEEGFARSSEFTLLRADGSIFLGELSMGLLKDASGNPIGSITIGRDITERKWMEEALQESEERYLTLVSLGAEVGEAVIMLQDTEQGEGVQSFVNDAWTRITGYSKEELLGMSFFDLVHPKHRQASIERHQRKMRGVAIPVLFEMSIIRKDGLEIPIELTSAYTTYKGEQGNVCYIRDITERKQAEERENQLQQELYLASRLATVGEMSSGIAHEINNPLTGVMGFSQLLMKKDISDDIRKDVDIIYEGAKRIASITERMLTFAHQHKPERTLVNINDIIETTLAMRTYEMESSNIKVTTKLSTDIPLTFADAGQLQQVFLNIVLNAEMEMKLAHGKGNLSVRTERIDNTIRVSFKDDGPGIPKKNLDRLFDPFFTTRDPDKGTGLGLSICYTIVNQHGGKIYARSKLGKGATFFVELPIVTQAEQLKMAETATEVSKTLPRARILVVDDEPIVQEFLTEMLGGEGHEVEIIENGDDALERLKSEDYDVILLDIKLPGMSGIELYEYMQNNLKSSAKKVVFITGDVMGQETMDFLSRTTAPYIPKPFDTEQLKKDIDRILSQQA